MGERLGRRTARAVLGVVRGVLLAIVTQNLLLLVVVGIALVPLVWSQETTRTVACWPCSPTSNVG